MIMEGICTSPMLRYIKNINASPFVDKGKGTNEHEGGYSRK